MLKWSTATQSSSGSEVFLHLLHHVAGEAAQIGKPVAVLGRDDEAKLVAVLLPALHELPSVRRIELSPIEPAPFSFPVRPVALQIAQMRVGSFASDSQPDDPRLHDDAAHPLARAAPLGGTLQPISRRLPSADAAASPFPGSTSSAAAWTAAVTTH